MKIANRGVGVLPEKVNPVSLFRRVTSHGSRLATALRRFWVGEGGVAAVEFGLILPILLLVYLGTMEASALYIADRRINLIAATAGDLVSQWNPADGELTESTLAGYLKITTDVMRADLNPAPGVVVSLVKVSASGATSVLWSRASAGATSRGAGSSYADLAATSTMNNIARGGCVIATEVAYPYRPMLGWAFQAVISLKRDNFFVPRFGNANPIDLDTTELATDACTA